MGKASDRSVIDSKIKSHNPNNYHWSEQDISEEFQSSFIKLLNENGFESKELKIKMLLVNRMNKLGLMFELSGIFTRDNQEIKLIDMDNYSDFEDKEIGEIFEKCKNTILQKYSEKQEVLQQTNLDQKKDPLKQFVKIIPSDKPTEIKMEKLLAEHDKINTRIYHSPKPLKTKSQFQFTFIGQLDEFFNYFCNPEYFKKISSTNDDKIIQLESVIISEMTKDSFNIKIDNEEVKVKIIIENSSNECKIKLEWEAENAERVKSFFRSFLFPKLVWTFSAQIIW
ncbi:hypothetical protein M153_1815000880 [Pseudoloma neurophilia]|uniref:Uncharacterized protein n=1 Tax=Pseudoloma neurophilia TaxID=146866 RepID=A0A0R0LUM9_9MICR|nr:hypothetical protein M153_1815000880 [Pseudoloma neurophilia]